MTEHPAAPTTEAGRVLLSSFDQFSEASGTDFPWLRESILAIEAEARSTPAEALDPLRSALERLLAVAMTEEEDVSAATQDEWIAAIKQANDALDGSTPAEALDPKRVEMWQRLIESRDYAAETGMDDIGDSIECLARWALDDIAAARAAARKEVLTPAEIRDLDMALRYSRIDHDYSCPAISPMALGDCTCGAAEYRERARLVTHRIGAPYRARSGDYLLDSLSTDTREEHGDAD